MTGRVTFSKTAIVTVALSYSLAMAAGPKSAPAPATASPAPSRLVQAKAPPFTDGIYPCKECHEGPGDRTRRTLGFHEEIQSAFDHDSENRWCLDCHDDANRDVLHLSSGDPLPFTESYRLCGQCHGDKYRDWRVGVHGKRLGRWDGEKTYLLCVNCHDPHSPRFKGVVEIEVAGQKTTAATADDLKPEPRPRRPDEIR